MVLQHLQKYRAHKERISEENLISEMQISIENGNEHRERGKMRNRNAANHHHLRYSKKRHVHTCTLSQTCRKVFSTSNLLMFQAARSTVGRDASKLSCTRLATLKNSAQETHCESMIIHFISSYCSPNHSQKGLPCLPIPDFTHLRIVGLSRSRGSATGSFSHVFDRR